MKRLLIILEIVLLNDTSTGNGRTFVPVVYSHGKYQNCGGSDPCLVNFNRAAAERPKCN